jgi:ferredoxin
MINEPNQTTAEASDRHSDNVPGAWYVNTNCIICGMCPENAPEIFQESADRDHARVHHQPVTPEEVAIAVEAMEGCPTDAIRNDGITAV